MPKLPSGMNLFISNMLVLEPNINFFRHPPGFVGDLMGGIYWRVWLNPGLLVLVYRHECFCVVIDKQN